jgi:hypothetical protein
MENQSKNPFALRFRTPALRGEDLSAYTWEDSVKGMVKLEVNDLAAIGGAGAADCPRTTTRKTVGQTTFHQGNRDYSGDDYGAGIDF